MHIWHTIISSGSKSAKQLCADTSVDPTRSAIQGPCTSMSQANAAISISSMTTLRLLTIMIHNASTTRLSVFSPKFLCSLENFDIPSIISAFYFHSHTLGFSLCRLSWLLEKKRTINPQ